jgi:hypothetical protein
MLAGRTGGVVGDIETVRREILRRRHPLGHFNEAKHKSHKDGILRSLENVFHYAAEVQKYVLHLPSHVFLHPNTR